VVHLLAGENMGHVTVRIASGRNWPQGDSPHPELPAPIHEQPIQDQERRLSAFSRPVGLAMYQAPPVFRNSPW
jgi:hypothetical protein